MAEADGQRAVAAHGMAGDPDPACVDGKFGGDQLWQLIRNIGIHCEMRRPGRLRRIDIEPGALPQIIGLVIGDAVAARAGVGGDEDHAEFSRDALRPRLLRHVVFGAGEAREVIERRARTVLRRQENRAAHRRSRRRAVMTDGELPPPENGVFRDDLHWRGPPLDSLCRTLTGRDAGGKRRVETNVARNSQRFTAIQKSRFLNRD